MGDSYKILKERNGFLEKKLEHFLSMIDVLYKNVMDRENEIDELTEVIKKTEKFSSRLSDTILDSLKSDSSTPHQNCEATEAFNAKEAFFKFKRSGIAPKKEVVDAPTNFSVGEKLECIKNIHGYSVGDEVEIKLVCDYQFSDALKPAIKVGASMLSLDIVGKYYKKIYKEAVGKTTKKRIKCLENYKLVIPSIKQAREAGIIGKGVSISSRFMPNVKFCIMGDKGDAFDKLTGSKYMYNYVATNPHGQLYKWCDYQGKFDDEWAEEEVSIYWAIPELVPEGMFYDKELDSLIKKNLNNMSPYEEKIATEAILNVDELHKARITVDIRDVVNFGGKRYYSILKK